MLKEKIVESESLIKYVYKDREIKNKKLIFTYININIAAALLSILLTIVASKLISSFIVIVPVILFLMFLSISTFILYKSTYKK